MSKVNPVRELQAERDRHRIARELLDQAAEASLLMKRGHGFFVTEEALRQLAKTITEARRSIGEYTNEYPYEPWEV